MLLEVNTKLLSFLKAVCAKGGVVNSHVVCAAAKALIDTSGETTKRQLSNIDLSRPWVQSVYRRMGLTRRMATTSRPPVPLGLFKECQYQYLRDVYDKVQKYAIPQELILNSDQTPSSYISVGKSTMASCGAKSVAIKGLTDKQTLH